jgi:hypothetical protein
MRRKTRGAPRRAGWDEWSGYGLAGRAEWRLAGTGKALPETPTDLRLTSVRHA